MKALLLCLLALLTAVIISIAVESDMGRMTLTFSDWTIQTSTIFFIILLFSGFILFYFCIRAAVRFFQLPKDIQTWQRHRHQRLAEKHLTRGLINMIEGQWLPAEKALCRAARHSETPYVAYLFAAQAAQKSDHINRRDRYLQLALQHNPDASLTVNIAAAKLQLGQKQTQQALAILKDLQHHQPGHTRVKQLLLNAYTDLRDWKSLVDLIPAMKRTAYPREELQSRQLEAYVGLLKQTGKSDDKAALENVWLTIPRKLKQHLYLIEIYVERKLKLHDAGNECEELLRNTIKRQWDSALVRLYGLVEGSNPARQLATAESWLRKNGRDAVLLLTLARICKRLQLPDKARHYLRESINAQANAEAYYELACLYESEGRTEQAVECYREGLTLVAGIEDNGR